MNRLPTRASSRARPPGAPLVWTFDGSFARCLEDMEDTLRRAIVQVGDVSRVVVAVDLSLPALNACVRAGERIQPLWSDFLERVGTRYGLPATPRVRYLKTPGPLAAFVIGYRS